MRSLESKFSLSLVIFSLLVPGVSGQYRLSQQSTDDLCQNSANQAQQMVQHRLSLLSCFSDFIADLQLTEGYFLESLCKTEIEPEPVIAEDQRVLALSLTNNTRLKGKK